MEIRSYVLQRIIQETSDVRSFIFDFGEHPFDFIPGQFVIVHLNAECQAPLTISSSPHDRKYFQVTVKRTGNFGTQFYDQMRVGEKVSIGRPMGQLKLQIDSLDPVCFIGCDYCIPAARSFFYYMLVRQPQRRLTLFHEITDPNQILYDKEFQHFEQNSPLTRVLLLNQQTSPVNQQTRPAGWFGGLGRITPIMVKSLYAENSSTKFYVAGEYAEVKFYQQTLQLAEIPKTSIFVERWS
ncbi:MAG: ferredoxin--NADP reductase [Acidobacteriota bacterium]